jgi:hypothetical protein
MGKTQALGLVAILLLATACNDGYQGGLSVEKPLTIRDTKGHEVTLPVGRYDLTAKIAGAGKLVFRLKDFRAHGDLKFEVKNIDVSVNTQVSSGDQVLSYEDGLWVDVNDGGQPWSLEGGASMHWNTFNREKVETCKTDHEDPLYGRYGIRITTQLEETQTKSIGAALSDASGARLGTLSVLYQKTHKIGDPVVGSCQQDWR